MTPRLPDRLQQKGAREQHVTLRADDVDSCGLEQGAARRMVDGGDDPGPARRQPDGVAARRFAAAKITGRGDGFSGRLWGPDAPQPWRHAVASRQHVDVAIDSPWTGQP